MKSENEESLDELYEDNTIDAQGILTTAQSLEGYKIIETLEIVTEEFCYGMNLFLVMLRIIRVMKKQQSMIGLWGLISFYAC